MLETVIALFKHYFSAKVIVFFVSILPILELRGGLIAASLLGVPWYEAAPIAVIANMLPVPFIILFIERILDILSHHGPIKKFARKIKQKGHSKGAELLEKYPNQIMIGVYLFVAIPLPGTGAWTGALIAALLGLSPKKSFFPISLGILTACIIMLIIAYFVPSLIGFQS
ncbi:COG2426 family protein [Atopobacter phocae]|uniref:COG2426 family protein n=1 Tax=Atopobacter phocae TaxID=136492 RepID=UPI000470A091|nr:small multi-drug export protein [Atopobacter phocae]